MGRNVKKIAKTIAVVLIVLLELNHRFHFIKVKLKIVRTRRRQAMLRQKMLFLLRRTGKLKSLYHCTYIAFV